MNFYYADENQRLVGPYSVEEMRQLFNDDILNGQSWVIVEGGNEWKSYESLFPAVKIKAKTPVVGEKHGPTAPTDLPPVLRLDESAIEKLRKRTKWFVAFQTSRGTWETATKETLVGKIHQSVRKKLIDDSSPMEIHERGRGGAWNTFAVTLPDLAKQHLKLRAMYQPVWSYAMTGWTWGAFVGAWLMILYVMFVSFDADQPGIAVGMAGFLLISSPKIPNSVRTAIMFLTILGSKLALKANPMALVLLAGGAIVAGVLLGGLPGMAIGGIKGFLSRSSIPRVANAPPEPRALFLIAVLLPAFGAHLLWALWMWVLQSWFVDLID